MVLLIILSKQLVTDNLNLKVSSCSKYKRLRVHIFTIFLRLMRESDHHFFKKKPIKLQFDTITPKAWLNHQFHFHFQSVNLSLLYCWLGFQQVYQA